MYGAQNSKLSYQVTRVEFIRYLVVLDPKIPFRSTHQFGPRIEGSCENIVYSR